MARRQELSLDIIEAVVKQVQVGHWPHVCAKRIGVQKSVWTAWMERGEKAHLADTGQKPTSRDGDYLYRQLFEQIEEAEAESEMEALRMLKEHADIGKTSWNGYLNFLERRFPDRWRKREAALGAVEETWEQQAKKWLQQNQA